MQDKDQATPSQAGLAWGPGWLLQHQRAMTWLLLSIALAGLVEAAYRGRFSSQSLGTFLDISPLLGPALATAAALLLNGRRRIALALLLPCVVWVGWGLASGYGSLEQTWLRWFGTGAACLGLVARLLQHRPATMATATAAGTVLLLLGLVAVAHQLNLLTPANGVGLNWSTTLLYFALAALLLPHQAWGGWRPSQTWYGAAATLGVAILCIAAWILDADVVSRLGTTHRPMPLTTALCVLLVSVAMLKGRSSTVWLAFPMVIVASLAVLALVDEFSVDGLSLARWLSAVGAPHAAISVELMAGSSAISLLVATASLVSLRLHGSQPSLLMVGWLGGALMAAASLLVLIGYGLDLAQVRAWGMTSPMAPASAICFLLLGLGMAPTGWWAEPANRHRRVLVLFPLIAGLAGAALSVGLWIELRTESQRVASDVAEEVLDGMEQAVRTSLENRIRAFQRLGYRLRREASHDEVSRFDEYAADYFREPSPLRSLALVDSAGSVLAESFPSDRFGSSLSGLGTAERRQLASQAFATGEPQASGALPWRETSMIFILVVPVSDGQNSTTLIASAYEVDAHIAQALKAHSGDYRIHLAPASTTSRPPAWSGPWVRGIDLLGQKWWLEFTPPTHMSRSPLPTSLLVAGLAASTLLSVALYLMALARRRAAVAQVALDDRRRIFDGSRDVICTLDRQGRFLEANPAANALWGLAPSTLIGRPYSELVLPEDVGKVRASWESIIEGNVATPLSHRCLRSDGSIVHAEWSVQWLHDSDRLVCLIRDVSERIAYEQRLIESMDDLMRKNRELQEFAYVASHDLQEPLRKVRSFTERVRDRAGPALEEGDRDYLQRAANAAARMQTLIHDLLEFTRVESRGRAFAPVALAEIIAGVRSDLEQSLEDSGGRIVCGALPVIEADATQMRQVFQNLLSNALKFRRPGMAPEIRLEAVPEHHAAREGYRITISDNGIGFDPQHTEEIFAPFKRLHGRGEYEGTGIGLSIVRRIVERHGGTITADSSPGQGATFSVWLAKEQKKH